MTLVSRLHSPYLSSESVMLPLLSTHPGTLRAAEGTTGQEDTNSLPLALGLEHDGRARDYHPGLHGPLGIRAHTRVECASSVLGLS